MTTLRPLHGALVWGIATALLAWSPAATATRKLRTKTTARQRRAIVDLANDPNTLTRTKHDGLVVGQSEKPFGHSMNRPTKQVTTLSFTGSGLTFHQSVVWSHNNVPSSNNRPKIEMVDSVKNLDWLWGDRPFTLHGRPATVTEIRKHIDTLGRPRSTSRQRRAILDLAADPDTRTTTKHEGLVVGQSERHFDHRMGSATKLVKTLALTGSGLRFHEELVWRHNGYPATTNRPKVEVIKSTQRLVELWGDRPLTLHGKPATVTDIRKRIDTLGRPRSTSRQRQAIIDLARDPNMLRTTKHEGLVVGRVERFAGYHMDYATTRITTLAFTKQGLVVDKRTVYDRNKDITVGTGRPEVQAIRSPGQLLELWGYRPFTLHGKPATVTDIRKHVAKQGDPRRPANSGPDRVARSNKTKKKRVERPSKIATPLKLAAE